MDDGPFRDRPNYDESAVWVGIWNIRGEQKYITLADYQAIIADSQHRQAEETPAQKKGKHV